MVTRTHSLCAATAALLTGLWAGPLAATALAAEGEQPEPTPEAAPKPEARPEPEKPSGPSLHHRPPAVAKVHEPLRVEAGIDHPHLVRRAMLLYRTPGAKTFAEVPFRRGSPGPYVAEVPEAAMIGPYLDYTIELERLDGSRERVFATRAAPHRVQVPPDGMDLIEQATYARLDRRRSVFAAGAEWVSFGKSTARVQGPEGLVEQQVDDSYYRVEGSYTYRPLRVISEFSIRGGVVRGRAPVPVRELQPGQSESERFDVGLNYGAPSVRFRFDESWHFDASFLINVTEVGFSVGTGAALHIGDVHGTKLVLGFEAIDTFGSRFYSRVDMLVHPRLKVSPIVEVTNMPSADDFGVRLVGEVGFDVGHGFAFSGRAGYQARVFTSGGVSGGGALSYAF